MSLSFNLRRSLGLEDNGIDVDINIGSTREERDVTLDDPMVSAVSSTGQMTPEAAEVEVQEASAEVDEVSAEMEEVDEDVSALESYYNALERSLDNRGINVVSAEMMNIGLNRILKKYRIDSTELMPGLESFSNNSYVTTQVSMETVKETLKNLKDSAGEYLEKIINAVIDFFGNLSIKLIPATKARLKHLIRMFESEKLDNNNNKMEIELKGVQALYGKSIKTMGVESTIKQFWTAALEFNGKFEPLLKEFETYLDYLKSGDVESEVNESNFNDLADKIDALAGTKLFNDKINSTAQGVIKAAKSPLGDKVFAIRSEGMVRKIDFNATDLNEALQINENETVKVAMAASDCAAGCRFMLTVLDKVEATSKAINKNAKLKAFKASFIKRSSDTKGSQKWIVSSIRGYLTAHKDFNKYILDVVKVLTSIAVEFLKTYKADSKASKKEDKKDTSAGDDADKK